MDWKPLFCGFCFGVYPIMANRSKLSYGATLPMLGLALIFFALEPFFENGIASFKAVTPSQGWWILGTAMVYGVGMFVLMDYLANASQQQVGIQVIIMVIVQILFTYASSSVLLKTVPSGRDVLGILAAIAAIVLLKK